MGGGTIARPTATLQDAAERRRMEEALHQSETMFRLLAENATDIVSRHAPDGTFLYVSYACRRLLGYEPEELVGRSAYEFMHPDDAAAARLPRALAPRYSTTFRYRRKDGTYAWFESLGRAVLDETSGAVTEFEAVSRDVTERRRAEEALRESEHRFRSVLDRMRLLGLGLNVAGQIVYCNDFLLEVTGWSRAEVFGADWLSKFLPTDHPVTAVFRLAMEIDEIPAQYVNDIIVRDGGRRTVQWNNTILHDAEGSVTGLVCIGEDVTERTRVVEDLRRSQAQLRALAQHLNSVREEEHTRIAREIHDGLGQALTALRLDLTWLARKLPRAGAAVREKIAAMIALADGTIASGRDIVAELRPPILDDLGLAPSLDWYVHRFAERADLRCEFDAGPAGLAVDGEVAVIAYRIAQEALTNVARHAKANQVAVRLGERDGALLVEIRDDGRGISDEAAANPRSLGIVGMRERATARGGSVEIGRPPEGGTLVRLTIPLERREPRAAR